MLALAALAHAPVHAAESKAATTSFAISKPRIDAALQLTGLGDYGRRWPHQLSGGQAQRVGIARALAVKPDLLLMDEPFSAVDAITRRNLQQELIRVWQASGAAVLFVTHDIEEAVFLGDRVVVMYLGRVVEIAPTEALFAAPNHPYTSALLTEVPRIDRKRRTFVPIKGEIPSPMNPPTGCHFHPRCPLAFDLCSKAAPALIANGAALVSCHAVNRPDAKAA